MLNFSSQSSFADATDVADANETPPPPASGGCRREVTVPKLSVEIGIGALFRFRDREEASFAVAAVSAGSGPSRGPAVRRAGGLGGALGRDDEEEEGRSVEVMVEDEEMGADDDDDVMLAMWMCLGLDTGLVVDGVFLERGGL